VERVATMTRLAGLRILVAVAAVLGFSVACSVGTGRADEEGHVKFLDGRLVAAAIPGVSAISPVGTFLPGGPIHDNLKFAAFTLPGQVLDPARILVGSTSNFGAPLANSGQLPGSFISIDPRGQSPLVIPRQFAATGTQASTLGGFVQMYSAQSALFLNSIHTPLAATASFTGVSNPLGLSINNAFGRLWPANAPYQLEGIGSSSILDPTGEPLAGAPNPVTGGVYAGNLSGRRPSQVIPGSLATGAVGTALLGRSPDGSGKAVFAVVTADGGIVQEQTLQGLDGLAPAGTVSPVLGRRLDKDLDKDREDARATPRVGVLLNYSPTRILYVSEPFTNSIAVINLTDDKVVFHVASVSHINSEALNQPIDMTPAQMETGDPDWASNTTLDNANGGSDFYIANRGNNTIVRMRQDGTVVAVRKVRLYGSSLGEGRLNGIAASSDGTKLWVTVVGRVPALGSLIGAVLEMPAFAQ
jgi:hypothetical protein